MEVILTAKRSEGVAQEVNLRDLLHKRDEARRREYQHRSTNQGYQRPNKRGLISSNKNVCAYLADFLALSTVVQKGHDA